MRMSIGAAMRALASIIGPEPFEYGIPRDSFEWTFNMDSTASKYGLMVSPDRRVYQADVSFNREGVNLIFTQPNKLRYVPTEFRNSDFDIESFSTVVGILDKFLVQMRTGVYKAPPIYKQVKMQQLKRVFEI